MDKPTLTPHADAFEKIAVEIFAGAARDAQTEGHDPVLAAMCAPILVATMREVMKQRDLMVEPSAIVRAFCGTAANVIMSVCGTISGAVEIKDDDARALMGIVMDRILCEIEIRLGVDLSDATHHYDLGADVMGSG